MPTYCRVHQLVLIVIYGCMNIRYSHRDDDWLLIDLSFTWMIQYYYYELRAYFKFVKRYCYVVWCDYVWLSPVYFSIFVNPLPNGPFILIMVNNNYIRNLVIKQNEFGEEAVLMGARLFSLRRMLTDEAVWSFIDYFESYLVSVNGKFFLLQTCSITLEYDRDGLNHLYL